MPEDVFQERLTHVAPSYPRIKANEEVLCAV